MSKYNNPHITGSTHEFEIEWLYEQAKKMDSVVEVGCWFGKSAHALLSGCRGKVYAVDTFLGSPSDRTGRIARERNVYAEFMQNVGHFASLNVMRMASIEAAEFFPDGSVDMIWIDADHDYVPFLADFRAWFRKCRKLICGHDRGHDGVAQGLKKLKVDYNKEVGSIWSYWVER